MTSSPTPLSIRTNSIFDLPGKMRRQRRLDSDEHQQQRQAAIEAREGISKSRAEQYLERFINDSEWSELKDRITIVYDAVPSMEELLGYGNLNENDGTRSCRRLFKAVVIWDELGHSLWVKLSDAAEKRRKASQTCSVATTPWPTTADDTAWSPISSSRRSSDSGWSADARVTSSCESLSSRRTSTRDKHSISVSRWPADDASEFVTCDCGGAKHHMRCSMDSEHTEQAPDSPSKLTRVFSQKSVSALKKLGRRMT